MEEIALLNEGGDVSVSGTTRKCGLTTATHDRALLLFRVGNSFARSLVCSRYAFDWKRLLWKKPIVSRGDEIDKIDYY